jgi:hypothetical protein
MTSASEFLIDGYAGNLTTLRTLQLIAGLSSEDAARFLFVSPETYRRWRADRAPNPTAVRLLAIRAGYLPWPEWQGWEMHNGRLFPPGYRDRGLTPGHVLAVPWLQQRLADLERRTAPPPQSGRAPLVAEGHAEPLPNRVSHG